MASRPLSAETIVHVVLLQHAGQGEDVADVVVDDQHLLARPAPCRTGAGPPASAACAPGSLATVAVQEERGLVEQPLRRAGLPDVQACASCFQAQLVLVGTAAVGVDDHRQVGQVRLARRSRSASAGAPSCRAGPGPGPRQSTRPLAAAAASASGRRRDASTTRTSLGRRAVRRSARAARRRLRPRAGPSPAAATNRVTSSSSPLQRLLRLDRLGDERPCAPSFKAALARLVGGDDADRNVPGGHVVLQPLQHAPAVDVGQEDVERDGVRLVLAGHRQGGGARAR